MRCVRNLSTHAWSATDYGNPSKKLTLREFDLSPAASQCSKQLRVKVNAVSLNPIDHWMVNGRGKNLRQTWEKLGNQLGLSNHDPCLGVIPGRDFHATVLDSGGQTYKEGDYVIGVRHPFDSGSLQEHLLVNETSLFPENSNLSAEENACLPFVTSTIMSSLGISGGLSLFGCSGINTLKDFKSKKVLIIGATGGLGTVLAQLLVQYQATVDVIGGIGVDKIENVRSRLSYHINDYQSELEDNEYDYVFDCADGKAYKWAGRFMNYKKSYLISYSSPLMQMLGSLSAMTVPEFILVHKKAQ
ncbi:unnamed protein product, partial [Oikopleura dioica]